MTTPEPPPIGSAQAGIGAVLRAARAKRGVSLAEMRVRTKIDARFLTALEADRFGDLPPLPFARGFLRTYATELGLDPEPLVERLTAVVSADPAGPRTAGREDLRRLEGGVTPARTMSRLRRAALMAAAVGSLLVVVLAISFIQEVREFNRPVQPEPQARPAPVASEQPRPAASAPDSTPGTTPSAPTPQASAAAPSAQDTAGITVDVQAVGRSWIRVQGEEGQIYEGVLTAGETRRWQSAGTMKIRIGNAAAVVVTVNGRPVGTLGRRGEVVSRTFTKDPNP